MTRPPIPRLRKTTRFRLYLAGAVSAPTLAYLAERGWIGLAEVTYGGALVALLNVLAAANVADARPDEPPAHKP